MIKKILRIVSIFFVGLAVCAIILGFIFPNTSSLVISMVTQSLPSKGHVARIRENLLAQDNYLKMLAKHEKYSVRQWRENGKRSFVKKYIYKTSTSMFDMNSFHDYWEVWVRTDIVKGKPLTSFLVRLGMIKDTNAETFFSQQCGSETCKSIMITVVRLYNKMYDCGVFKPIRLNITELDQTSSVSRTRLTLKQWHRLSAKVHQQQIGMSFGAKK